MRELLISAIKVATLAYLGYAVVLFFLQRRMLFPGGGRVPEKSVSSDLGPGMHRVRLELHAGLVEAWYMEAEPVGRPGPALVFAHGNAELIEDWTGLAELTRLGVGVLLVEFPGYGHSAGETSRSEIAAAFLAGYDWLVERPDVDPERIVVMGRSIGGGAATDLVASRPVRALILQSTFSSLSRMAWEAYRVPRFLVRDAYDNETVVRSFDGPLLLMHGLNDDIIPFTHARALADARPDAELIEWDCGHNDCPPDWDAFIADVKDFLERHSVIEGGGGSGDS